MTVELLDVFRLLGQLAALLVPIMMALIWALHTANRRRFDDMALASERRHFETREQLRHQDDCLDRLRREASDASRASSQEAKAYVDRATVDRMMEGLAEIRATVSEIRANQQQAQRRIEMLESRP